MVICPLQVLRDNIKAAVSQGVLCVCQEWQGLLYPCPGLAAQLLDIINDEGQFLAFRDSCSHVLFAPFALRCFATQYYAEEITR